MRDEQPETTGSESASTAASARAEYLRKKRYNLVAAGYSCRFGEIDLIVSNRKYLVFVEVKLRKSGSFAKAMEYVDRRKQDRIRMTASMYFEPEPHQPAAQI